MKKPRRSRRPEPAPLSDEDLDRVKRDRKRREERFTNDILTLLKEPKYKFVAQELLNIKRALEAREESLISRESIIGEKEKEITNQKKRLSRQAAKLAKLKGELEIKISKLEKRLEALEKTK